MSGNHIEHLHFFKEVVAFVAVYHICLGFIFTFFVQFIEYILECIYSCRNLSTVISGLVSLHLSDFSGGVGFDDSVFDVDRAKVTGGFGNSLV